MRKLLTVSTIALSALSLSMAGADATVDREITGNILAPTFTTPDTPAAEGGTYTRQARCAYLAAKATTGNGTDANGVLGWVIELEEEEADGAHTFALTSDAGNVGVTFYEDLTNCESSPPPAVSGESFTDGGEEGQIPWFSTHAIVVVEDATQANFSFTIYEPEVA